MKKLLMLSAGLLCLAGSAFAGANAGTTAYLSWNALSNVYDTPGFSGQSNLYVRYTRATAMTFKGGEIDITWEPAGNFEGCFDVINVVYKTSSGTTCTYMNRGSAVPVTIVEANRVHAAWANTSTLTTCTAGAIIQIQFQNDTCADGTGCISLNSATILDNLNNVDQVAIGNAIVTVDGGGTHTCQQPTPVRPATWGTIKGLFVN